MGKVHMSLFHKSMMPHGMCTLHADARPRLPYVVVYVRVEKRPWGALLLRMRVERRRGGALLPERRFVLVLQMLLLLLKLVFEIYASRNSMHVSASGVGADKRDQERSEMPPPWLEALHLPCASQVVLHRVADSLAVDQMRVSVRQVTRVSLGGRFCWLALHFPPCQLRLAQPCPSDLRVGLLLGERCEPQACGTVQARLLPHHYVPDPFIHRRQIFRLSGRHRVEPLVSRLVEVAGLGSQAHPTHGELRALRDTSETK